MGGGRWGGSMVCVCGRKFGTVLAQVPHRGDDVEIPIGFQCLGIVKDW